MPLPVTGIVAVYGTSCTRWLGACLESLVNPGEVRSLIVVTDVVQPAWAKWADARDVSLAAIKITEAPDKGLFHQFCKTPALARLARLVAWRAALHLLVPGTRFVALDVDTLAQRPLTQLFDEASPPYCTLALPRILKPSGRYFYDGAVLAGQAAPMVERYVDDALRECQRLVPLAHSMVEMYGTLESAVWQALVNRMDESGGVIAGALPLQWCHPGHLTSTTPLTKVGLVHFAQRPPEFNLGGDIAEAWHMAKKRSGL